MLLLSSLHDVVTSAEQLGGAWKTWSPFQEIHNGDYKRNWIDSYYFPQVKPTGITRKYGELTHPQPPQLPLVYDDQEQACIDNFVTHINEQWKDEEDGLLLLPTGPESFLKACDNFLISFPGSYVVLAECGDVAELRLRNAISAESYYARAMCCGGGNEVKGLGGDLSLYAICYMLSIRLSI